MDTVERVPHQEMKHFMPNTHQLISIKKAQDVQQ